MPLKKKIIAATTNSHFQSILGNGIVAVFGLVNISILYRALSIKDIGIYVIFFAILGLIDMIRTGFLTNAFVKFYSGAAIEKAREVAGSAWLIALIITAGLILLSILATCFSAYIHYYDILFFLKYFPWLFLSTLPFFMASLILQGDQRFDRLTWLKLISQVSFAATILILAISKKATLQSIILAYILSNLASSLVAIILGWTRIGTVKYLTKSSISELFHFGKYSMGTSVSVSLFKVTDVFFINYFLGPVAVAIYNLGGRLSLLIDIPLGSLISSGMPGLSVHYNHNEKEKMMQLMKKMAGMISAAIFVIAVFSLIFAEPIIGLVGGAKYPHTEAPNLFRIFMIIAAFSPVDRFFAVTLDVIHKPKINFYKILLMLTANLLADYIGLTFFKSVYIVAAGNVFPLLVAIIVTYIPLNKYSPFNLLEIYKIGYHESMLLLKESYNALFNKSPDIIN